MKSMQNIKTALAIFFISALTLTSMGLGGCDFLPAKNNPPPTPEPPVVGTYDGEVTVHILAVKSGLSVFIDAGGTEILIDAGKNYTSESTAERTNVSEYIGAYISDGVLEYAIATHADSDHIGGLPQIYEDYQVARTIYGNKSDTDTYHAFEEAAMSEPNSTFEKQTDETISLGDDVAFEIIKGMDDATESNNNSVISLLHYRDKKLLVTGDAEKKEELALLGRVGAVDVYVVGHHGANTSSSKEFLAEISPLAKMTVTYGIISSAHPDTGYHHPRIEVLQRLRDANIKAFATYRSGNIIVTFNGDVMSLSPPDSDEITTENYRDAA